MESSGVGWPRLAQLGFGILPGTPVGQRALATNDDGQWSITTRTEINILVSNKHTKIPSHLPNPHPRANQLLSPPFRRVYSDLATRYCREV